MIHYLHNERFNFRLRIHTHDRHMRNIQYLTLEDYNLLLKTEKSLSQIATKASQSSGMQEPLPLVLVTATQNMRGSYE